AAPAYFSFFLLRIPVLRDPDLHQESADRKFPVIVRLQLPDKCSVSFSPDQFICKTGPQVPVQIYGQAKHNRHKKELCQKQYHQSRTFIHPRNIKNEKKKGEKSKFLHLRSSPIGGISTVSATSRKTSSFVRPSIFAAPDRETLW